MVAFGVVRWIQTNGVDPNFAILERSCRMAQEVIHILADEEPLSVDPDFVATFVRIPNVRKSYVTRGERNNR